MPSKRKPARPRWRSGILAGTIVVLIGGAIGYLALKPSRQTAQRPTGCVAGSGSQALGLTVSQAAIAATIAGVASERHLPLRAVAIAYATALQESKLANLHYGDLDSVGVFQQRPSEGWGTTRQIENPVYATRRFFDALVAVPNYLRMPMYMAAQAVQHSADGSAYAQYAGPGVDLADAFTGTSPRGVWCTYGSAPGRARLGAAARMLSSIFGPLAQHSASDPAQTLSVRDARQGWAITAWLESNAADYGIRYVRYDGYQWLGFRGSGHWTAEPPRIRTQAEPSAVVFG